MEELAFPKKLEGSLCCSPATHLQGLIGPVLEGRFLKFPLGSKIQFGIYMVTFRFPSAGAHLASVDLRYLLAHYYLPSHQRYLHFSVGMQHYQFVVLPFGQSKVPQPKH